MPKRFFLFPVLLVLPFLCPLVLTSAEPSPDDKKPKDTQQAPPEKKLSGYYAMMAKELNFSNAQSDRMLEMLDARERAIDEWRKENSEKLAELKKKYTEAKENGNKEEANKIAGEKKKLEEAGKQVKENFRDKINSVLTDEQQIMWKGVQFYYTIVGRFKPADLTDEQKTEVKEKCIEALRDANQSESDTAKMTDEEKDKLIADIEENILTEEQREIMKNAKPARRGPKQKNRGKGTKKIPGTPRGKKNKTGKN